MLTVNIPTRGRPDKLLKCIQSILDDKGNRSVTKRIIVFCHNRKEDIHPEVEEIRKDYYIPIVDNRSILTIESHNKALELYPETSFIGLSDDIVFHPDCLSIAYAHLEEKLNLNGVCDIKVANMESPDGCYMIIGKPFADRFIKRHAYCPEYKFMYASLELVNNAKELMRYTRCNEAKLDHRYPFNNPDETHKRIRKSDIIGKDMETYDSRKCKDRRWGINEGLSVQDNSILHP